MRPFALVLRAGAAVIAVAFVVSLLVDGTPAPVALKARAATKPETKATTTVVKTTPRPNTPAGVVTIAATGDIVMGSTPNLPPDGGRSFFDSVETDLAGDVVLGNLEGTLSVGGGSKCGAGSSNCYAFQTPPSYAAWLKKAGFTVMNLANNHAYDYGPSGQAQTLAALRSSASRPRAGPARSPTSRWVTSRSHRRLRAVPVGAVADNIPAAKRLVKKAAANADMVIVTMHAGAEGRDTCACVHGTEMFLGENRGNSRAFTHAVVDAGADVVVGSGPHVLRGMEWYHGHLIAYSLGNFAGYKVFAMGGPLSLSGILRVTLRGDGGFDSATLVPTRMVGAGLPALDPAETAHGIVRTLSKEDFGARAVKVSANGS